VHGKNIQAISERVEWFSLEISVCSVHHSVVGDIRNLCMCVFHMCVCAVCVCMCVCVCVCMRESVHVYVCMYVCVMGVRKQSSESTYSMVQLQSVNRMGMRLPSPGRGWLATCWEASQQDCTCQSTPEPVQGQQSGLERSSEGWPSRYCSPLPRRCPVGPHCIPPVLWDLHGHSRTHTTVY